MKKNSKSSAILASLLISIGASATLNAYKGSIINALPNPVEVTVVAVDPFAMQGIAHPSALGGTMRVQKESIPAYSSIQYEYGSQPGQGSSSLIYPDFDYQGKAIRNISPQAGGHWIIYQDGNDIETTHRF